MQAQSQLEDILADFNAVLKLIFPKSMLLSAFWLSDSTAMQLGNEDIQAQTLITLRTLFNGNAVKTCG